MRWKRIEKEFQKVGKSVENEGKRLKNRLAESQPRHDLTSAPSTRASKSQTQLEINVNPYRLMPGRAYIFNHVNFNNSELRKRVGSEFDVRRLQAIFRKFQIKVKLITDATLTEIRATMEKISQYNFQNVSCLVIVVMSHGHEGNWIAAHDGIYSLDYDIMYQVLRNPSLKSKLKLFITQACKGPINCLHLEIEGPISRPTTIPAEILQLNSCVEGYVSYINPRNGSIFINTLCDNLEKLGTETDILTIANKTVADVKECFEDIQIPMIHSNLTKQFVFGHYIAENIETYTNSSSDED